MKLTEVELLGDITLGNEAKKKGDKIKVDEATKNWLIKQKKVAPKKE